MDSIKSCWRQSRIATDETHHTDIHGDPIYEGRFDWVLKYHEPGLAPVGRDGLAWHIDLTGNPAYPQRFLRTFGFYCGVAAVIAQDGWHHIHPDGTEVYAERYQWCGNFQENCCTIRAVDGSYFHIDHTGKALYAPERWRYAGDFRDGIAVVQNVQGYSTHITLEGKRVHQKWFLDLDVYHKGFARARDEGGWMHINQHGDALYPQRFAAVEPFYNGQARVEDYAGRLMLIDEMGRTIHELRPARTSAFAELSSDMVGFWKTQTIAAAVQLKILEKLPTNSTTLAHACGAPVAKMERLLRALAELHIVESHDTHNTGGLERDWQITPKGAFLLPEHPTTLSDAALEYANGFSALWQQLPKAVGSEVWDPAIFSQVALDPERCMGHHRMLQNYAIHDYQELPKLLKLRGNEDVIDAGGGLGILASFLLQEYPQLTITILERPEVCALAHEQRRETDRLRWCAADICESWPTTADVIVFARVLHDWDDQRALTLLKNARAALRKGGSLVILEMLLSEEHPSGSLCDLHLLAVTGGQERTLAGFQHLLLQAGFQLRAVQRMSTLPTILIAG